MISIHELLSRIRWDPQYAKGQFKIGYYDRVEDRVILVAFEKISFDPDDRFCFELMDDKGGLHHVPLHRVKAVYRDDALIWHREH